MNSYSRSPEQRGQRTAKYVCVGDEKGKIFHLSDDCDGIERNVSDALLNTRAWVMQESVLARHVVDLPQIERIGDVAEESIARILPSYKDQLRAQGCSRIVQPLITLRIHAFKYHERSLRLE